MDKSCDSTTTPTTSTSSNSTGRDQYLKNLNKLSLKISKPVVVTRKPPAFDHHNQNQNLIHQQQSSQQPQLSQAQTQTHDLQTQQHQPPVYNINKNDFRDVVQKLTGSPAHERFSTPPPIQAPKAPSSRLQRIRPSPLAHVSNRPPALLNNVIPHQQHQALATIYPLATATAPGGFTQWPGAPLPLSPLPPLPSVHGAAESPVSAYMRYFQIQNSMSNVDPNQKQFSGFSPLVPLNSPRWNNSTPQQPPQILPPSSASGMPASQPQFQLPSSPLAFGCSNSLRSPYPLLSPGQLFPPSSGPLGFPLSPTVQVPVPSP